jgi:hypothetical protein
MHFIKTLVDAAFLYMVGTNYDIVGTSSCDTFALYFVVWDELVEYEVYEGLVPIIFFFSHQHLAGEVLGFARVGVVLYCLGLEA